MRFLRRVALLVDWALALLVGASAAVWGIWATISPVPVAVPYTQAGRTSTAVIALAGLVVVALNLVLLWGVLSRVFGMEYLKLDSARGRISVSVRALEEALERAVHTIAEVTAARIRVSPPASKGKPVVLKAFVSLRGSVVYHSISRSIMNVLEATFNDIVSQSMPVQCHVYWEKIRQDKGAAASPPAESMRPQFPVDEEQ